MRSSLLALWAATLGLALNAAPARAAWVEITGGKLAPGVTNQGTPASFHPKAVHIRILDLPTGWSAGAGRCHTVKHVDYKRVEFGFYDGLTNGAKLTAQGFVLDGLLKNTYVTLCRDKSGRIASFAAQLVYYKTVGNVIKAYGVTARNKSPVSGSSSVTTAELFAGQNEMSTTATSKASNRLQYAP